MLIVVLSQGTHDAVPEQKVESVISFEELVMLVMGNRGIDPFSDTGAMEIFGVEFPSEMTIDVVDDHEKEKDHKICSVHGKGKEKDDQDACLYNGFQGMKGIGSPGGWVG